LSDFSLHDGVAWFVFAGFAASFTLVQALLKALLAAGGISSAPAKILPPLFFRDFLTPESLQLVTIAIDTPPAPSCQELCHIPSAVPYAKRYH